MRNKRRAASRTRACGRVATAVMVLLGACGVAAFQPAATPAWADAGGSTLTIAWDNSGYELTLAIDVPDGVVLDPPPYNVYYTCGGVGTFFAGTISGGTAEFPAYCGTPNGTMFYAQVRGHYALDNTGWDGDSPWTPAPALDAPTLNSATYTNADADGNNVTLDVTPPSLPGGATIWGYDVRRDTSGGGSNIELSPANGQAPSLPLRVPCPSLNPNDCSYAVTALIGDPTADTYTFASPQSSPELAVTPTLDAPTLNSAIDHNGDVTLDVTPPSLPSGATIWGYDVRFDISFGGGGNIDFGPSNGQAPALPLHVTCGSSNANDCSYAVTALIGDPTFDTYTFASPQSTEIPAIGAVPGAPKAVSATPGPYVGSVWVFFAPPDDDGGSPITRYTAVCTSPDGTSGSNTGASSPIVVTGLTPGATYTCTVYATNDNGNGPASDPSGPVSTSGSPPPPSPFVSIANHAELEGNSGTHKMAFVVTLSQAVTQKVTVQYTTADITATGGAQADPGVDYQSEQGTVTFTPDKTTGLTKTSKTIEVPVFGDTTVEPDETFSVRLSNPVGGNVVLGAGHLGIGTILNDDGATGHIGVNVGDRTLLEGDSGKHTMLFPVTLSRPATQSVTVEYSVTGDTDAGFTATGGAKAGPGVDFQTKTGTLTFTPSATTGVTPISATISVTVFGDTTVEPDETFAVTLANPSAGVLLGDHSVATGTIANDDTGTSQGIMLGVGDTSIANATAGKQALKFEVSLSAKATSTVTVDYAITPVTATYNKRAGEGGYGGKTSGTITFAPGATLKYVNVPIWPDAYFTTNKTFTITLSGLNGAGVTLVGPSATGTIFG